MKKLAMAGLFVTLLGGATLFGGEDKAKMPEMPAPAKEHVWLQQLVGEWETEFECVMEPGKPALKGKGTEKARSLGGFWVVAEGEATMDGMPGAMNSLLTLGYDPEKKKYTGTWVDSMTSHLWKYEGAVDSTGKVLTFECEGPCPTKPGKLSKFRDVTEIKDKNHRVFTSSILGDDGQWTKMVTVNYRRKS